MGRATITGTDNGATARYQIEIDTGSAQKAAKLSEINGRLAVINAKLPQATQAVTDAETKLQTLQAQAEFEINQYQQQVATTREGESLPEAKRYKEVLADVIRQQFDVRDKRTILNAMKADKAALTKQLSFWTAFEPIESRSAWCVSNNKSMFPGFSVGTIEVPDEPDLTLIAPLGRQPIADDGQVVAREVQRPEQVYFNAAILPGVQKHKPQYRLGTITGINYAAATCDVTLLAAYSSAQALGVNDRTTLTNVPIVYELCNAFAFAVGDVVVVQFLSRSWDQPQVIGFRDNPWPCESWGNITLWALYELKDTTPFNGATRPKRRWCYGVYGDTPGGLGDFDDLWQQGTGQMQIRFVPILQDNKPTSSINVDLPSPVKVADVVNPVSFPEDAGRVGPLVPYGNSPMLEPKTYTYTGLPMAPSLRATLRKASFVQVTIDGQLYGTNTFGTFTGQLWNTQYNGPNGWWGNWRLNNIPGGTIYEADEVVDVAVPIPTVSKSYRGLTRTYSFIGAYTDGPSVFLEYQVDPL